MWQFMCSERIVTLTEDTSPIRALNELERRGKSIALKSLRIGINDLLTWSRDMPRETVLKANAYLKEHGAISLSEMQRKVWKRIPRILRRGRIQNEEEYYLLVEIVNDVDSDDLTEDERKEAEHLLANYEHSKR